MKFKIIFCIVFGMIFCKVALSQEDRFRNIADIELKAAKKTDVVQMKNSRIGQNKIQEL